LPERGPGQAVGSLGAYGVEEAVPVYARERLAAGQRISGPALVTEPVATSWLASGWEAEVDAFGSLLLERPEPP